MNCKSACDQPPQLNANGRTKIRTPDILEYAVSKLRESDIETIQEKYYSPADKIDLLLERINRERSDNPMTKEQLLASMLDNFKPGQVKNGGAHKETQKSNKLGLKKELNEE